MTSKSCPHRVFTAVSARRDDAVVLHAAGALDLDSAPVLRKELHHIEGSPEVRVVIVDLEAVTFCDSIGMSELVLALHRGEAQGRRFMLAGVPAALTRLLAVTALDRAFDIHPTLDDALRAATAP
ncbi:STAS domain-containing protein [Sphaerisporangium sp. NPDC005288]|uniref:STAS domain-containing protein n=1 Tax=Sphaerisporangium sp. NPDC005288 TaxID=3155114 RepID=UPI0033B50EF6